MTLHIGLIPPSILVKWGCFLEVHSTGLIMVWILGLVAFLMWNCSFFMSFGLGERLSLEKASSSLSFDQGVQFQCRLFLLVQALIFGVPVVFSEL